MPNSLPHFPSNPQSRLDVHYPVARKRHLNKSAEILAAPVVNQPGSAFVRADDVQRFKFFSAFGGNFFLQVRVGKGGYNFFSLGFDFMNVILKLSKVQLARKVGNLLFYKLVSGRDNRL